MVFSKLIEFISADKSRYGYRNFFKCFFLVPGFRFTVYLRISKYLESKNKILYFLAKIYVKHMSYQYGIDMYSTTTIGKGFYIGHFDVPDYSLVMGSPGVIVKENYKKTNSDQ
jgi:serine O-acetyltransferase